MILKILHLFHIKITQMCIPERANKISSAFQTSRMMLRSNLQQFKAQNTTRNKNLSKIGMLKKTKLQTNWNFYLFIYYKFPASASFIFRVLMVKAEFQCQNVSMLVSMLVSIFPIPVYKFEHQGTVLSNCQIMCSDLFDTDNYFPDPADNL